MGKEERDDQLEDVSCKSVEKKSMVVKEHVAARAPLTDEERIERLLKRCHGEGIVSNAAEAEGTGGGERSCWQGAYSHAQGGKSLRPVECLSALPRMEVEENHCNLGN